MPGTSRSSGIPDSDRDKGVCAPRFQPDWNGNVRILGVEMLWKRHNLWLKPSSPWCCSLSDWLENPRRGTNIPSRWLVQRLGCKDSLQRIDAEQSKDIKSPGAKRGRLRHTAGLDDGPSHLSLSPRVHPAQHRHQHPSFPRGQKRTPC